MKAFILALTLLAPVVAASNCTPPPTIVTPQGKTAYTADQIAIRVNELEAAAIQANATGGLPVATTRIVVKFTVSADKILKDVPSGWQTAVATAWTQTKQQLAGVTNPNVVAAISAVDLVLAAFLP